MTYSLDFRKRVMNMKEKNKLTYEKISRQFGISMRTLFNWNNRIEPRENRNKPATKIDMDKLKEDVKRHPDDFQHERAERFGVSPNGILYALRRLRISNKKNSQSPRS